MLIVLGAQLLLAHMVLEHGTNVLVLVRYVVVAVRLAEQDLLQPLAVRTDLAEIVHCVAC